MTGDQVRYQQQYYNRHSPKRAAAVADQSDHALFRSFNDRLAGLVLDRGAAPGRAVRVLEIGSGEGLLSAAFQRLATVRGVDLAYTGTDLSQSALDLAAAVVPGTLIQGDATQVVAALPAGSQDLAVVKNLLHHLDDPADLLRAAARAVGPDGRVVIIEACLGAPQFWPFVALAPRREKHFFKGRRRNVAAMADAGLDVVSTDKFGWLPYELAFAIRFDWFRRLFGTDDPRHITRISRLDDRLTSSRALSGLASYIVWTTAPRAIPSTG
ncbi:MAG: hypothetical protein QOE93_1562 [Actinomycetota bacterium]|nr:hypothetical protein [Actinomycetota bacterium]